MVLKYLQSGLISLLSLFLFLKFAGCQVSKICPCKGIWVPQLQLSSCNSAESGYWWGCQRSHPNTTCTKGASVSLLLWSSYSPRSFSLRPKGSQKNVLYFPALHWKRAVSSSLFILSLMCSETERKFTAKSHAFSLGDWWRRIKQGSSMTLGSLSSLL